MIDPEALAMLVATTAVAMAEGKSDEEAALIASILMQIADTMTTIIAARGLVRPEEGER